MNTFNLRSKPGSFERYTARHISQPNNPETLNPKTLPTAFKCPREAISPSALKRKGRRGRLLLKAIIFFPKCTLPNRELCSRW